MGKQFEGLIERCFELYLCVCVHFELSVDLASGGFRSLQYIYTEISNVVTENVELLLPFNERSQTITSMKLISKNHN